MSANETINVSATGGQKAGNDERYDLIPAEPLRRLAVHAGTRVYGQRGGSYHQMMAHAWKFWNGEEVDPETYWVNLIYAAFEAFRIVDHTWRPPTWAIDDRSGGERYDRIPPDALRQLALHFGVGARKYADDNWCRGYDWRLTFAAANRHAWQWFAGEEFDPETGSNHLIAFAWHMLILDEFTRTHPEYDTRTSTKILRWLEAENIYLWLVAEYEHHERDRRRRRLKIFRDAIEAVEPATAAPRIVAGLTDSERDAQWAGKAGRYRWDDRHSRWTRKPNGGETFFPTVCYTVGYGPFTEALN